MKPTTTQLLDFLAKAQALGMHPRVQGECGGYTLKLEVKYESNGGLVVDKEEIFFDKDGEPSKLKGSYPFDIMVQNIEDEWQEYQEKQRKEERRRGILAAMSEEDRKLFL